MKNLKLLYGTLPLFLGLMITPTSSVSAQENKEPVKSTNGCPTCLPIVSYGAHNYFYFVGRPAVSNAPAITSDVVSLTIDPPLAAGLNFDPTTGAITGTPTEPSLPLGEYKAHFVKAFDSHGRCGTTTIRVVVYQVSSPMVFLKNLL